jgi:hypothetical protein
MSLYDHYDHSHTHPVNRALHALAIPLGLSSIYFFARKRPLVGLSVIPSAFALAWLGHLIEGNKPAFLSNPAHVLVAPVWLARRVFSNGS